MRPPLSKWLCALAGVAVTATGNEVVVIVGAANGDRLHMIHCVSPFPAIRADALIPIEDAGAHFRPLPRAKALSRRDQRCNQCSFVILISDDNCQYLIVWQPRC